MPRIMGREDAVDPYSAGVRDWRQSAFAFAVVATTACNLISGADRIELLPEQSGGTGSMTGSGAGSSASVGPGPASSSSGGTSELVAADGVTVTEIKLYQGVERPLMKGGDELDSDIPIVAGRDAYLRVFYKASASSTGVLRVTFGDGPPIEVPTTLAGSSDQQALETTANAAIPGARIGAATSMRVELLTTAAQSSGTNTTAAYPPSGLLALPIQAVGATLKVVLVPVAYAADGSNRLPDTSQQQVDRYRDALFRLYPVPSVTVTVKPAVTWNQAVDPGGDGWNDLLNAITDYRQTSGAANDEYYYGLFNAAGSFGSFCSSGCVAGLSLLAGPNDPMSRAGIGIGFTGEESAGTAAHELGHQHGRPHAPCGVSQSVDPFFPRPDGSIGAWGFDLLAPKLIAPDAPDFMSYCEPAWVSDFTFKQLFNRIKLVNNAAWIEGSPVLYDRIAIAADGTTKWLEPLLNSANPSGEATALEVTTTTGKQHLVGRFYPYSHLSGGVMLVPKTAATVHSVAFNLAGRKFRLPR